MEGRFRQTVRHEFPVFGREASDYELVDYNRQGLRGSSSPAKHPRGVHDDQTKYQGQEKQHMVRDYQQKEPEATRK